MNAEVLEAIDNLVHSIYTTEQTGVNEYFMALLDALELFVNRMNQAGYQVDINKELLRIQEAFTKKDYVMLADVLLDEVRPEFENLNV